MKNQTTKKIFACLPVGMAFIIMMMFSFTFVSAQCPGNKILVYKCIGGGRGNCVSKCVNPNNIPNAWSHGCPCLRLANEQVDGELSKLVISPNPVSGSSVIYFFLEQSENVSLRIFDLNGKLVTTLVCASVEEGDHEFTWNAADVNSGVYFLRLETASYSENRKLIITK